MENYISRKMNELSSIMLHSIYSNKTNFIRNKTKYFKHTTYSDRSVKIAYTNNTWISPRFNSTSLDAVIAIPTSPTQFTERFVLRNTRCHPTQLEKNIKCIFFCGIDNSSQTINEFVISEGEKYDDLVQFDFINDYINLTTLQLSSFHWILTYTPNIQYYVRTDSDLYLNNSQMLQIISKPRTLFTFGKYHGNSRPQRGSRSKWYMPYDVYPYDVYKPYHPGYFWIWSRDILELMMKGIEYVKPIHYIEDIYFGQILYFYNISLGRCKSISMSPLTIDKAISSNWKKYTAIHGYTPAELLCIDKLIRKKTL